MLLHAPYLGFHGQLVCLRAGNARAKSLSVSENFMKVVRFTLRAFEQNYVDVWPLYAHAISSLLGEGRCKTSGTAGFSKPFFHTWYHALPLHLVVSPIRCYTKRSSMVYDLETSMKWALAALCHEDR